jgi:PiT family inorganic phosphate transporter
MIQAATLILAFYMAWNIGANDVANAMGTSVGSRALTLRRAVFLAAILEFSGAFFVGSNVSETIQKGIIDPTVFQSDPMIFVLGMMGSLLATGALLQLASYFGLPISTTHAIVGAVIGFGAFVGGIDAVYWKEFGWIASSWVLSPFLSGIISYTIFTIIQKKFLSTEQLLPVGQLPEPYPGPYPPYPSPYQGVEKIFVPMQIISACLVAFAHGANDVANAIGPAAAVLGVLKTHTINASSTVPSWLLALGGGGIVIGLASWGWRVIETVGKKITELTPTRGFAAEFGAATTILLASKLGLPISTTHALIGAVLGVGMARGSNALNFQTLKEIVISWIVTIPLCALFSILSFYLLKACFI